MPLEEADGDRLRARVKDAVSESVAVMADEKVAEVVAVV